MVSYLTTKTIEIIPYTITLPHFLLFYMIKEIILVLGNFFSLHIQSQQPVALFMKFPMGVKSVAIY